MPRFDNGWVKLHRRAINEDIGRNGYALAVWVTLLAWASRFETKIQWKGQQRVIPPGSVVCGISELADHLRFSKTTVYRWIKYLTKTERVRYESEKKGSLITICNWADYQHSGDIEETSEKQEVNVSESAASLQKTPNGEVKKERSNLSREQIKECAETWKESLAYLHCERPVTVSEETAIVRAIQSQGLETVRLALFGFRYEPKKDGYDPSDYAFAERVLDPAKISRFVSLAAKNQPKSREVFEGSGAC